MPPQPVQAEPRVFLKLTVGLEEPTDPSDVYANAAWNLAAHAIRENGLDLKTKSLVLVALAVAPTQISISRDELRSSIVLARQAGVTDDELMCVAQLASVVGLHSCSVGIPLLVEELGRRGDALMSSPYTEQQAATAEAFETTGPRPRPIDSMFDAILRMDVEYFGRLTTYLDAPWEMQSLTAIQKELIYIAIDVACTHLHEDGIRRHVGAALDLGVDPGQILEVMQLASLTGFRSVRVLNGFIHENTTTRSDGFPTCDSTQGAR